ncbi:MAG: VPLPA-CTERM sorting domain-containing protein [Halioglobus sp.]
MNLTKTLLASVALWLSMSHAASATVITFDDVTTPGLLPATSYSSDGYTLSAFRGATTAYLQANRGQTSTFNDGENYLSLDYNTEDVFLNIANDAGNTFILESLDLGTVSQTAHSQITLTGFLGGSQVATTGAFFVLYGELSNNAVTPFDGVSLDRLEIELTGNKAISFDNIALTSAVPVPAAAWLFGSALLGLVGVKRKKA